MKTLIKIILFPARLVLFLILKMISVIISTLNHTVIFLCVTAASIIQAIGVAACVLGVVGLTAAYIIDYERASSYLSILEFMFVIFVGLLIMAAFYFLPVIFGALYVWLDIAVKKITDLANRILFLRKAEKTAYTEYAEAEPEQVHFLEIDGDVDEETAIKGIQESAKLFSKYGVNSAEELERKIYEQYQTK